MDPLIVNTIPVGKSKPTSFKDRKAGICYGSTWEIIFIHQRHTLSPMAAPMAPYGT